MVMALLRRPSTSSAFLPLSPRRRRRAVAEHLTRLGYVDAEVAAHQKRFPRLYLERERANGRELHLAASAMQPGRRRRGGAARHLRLSTAARRTVSSCAATPSCSTCSSAFPTASPSAGGGAGRHPRPAGSDPPSVISRRVAGRHAANCRAPGSADRARISAAKAFLAGLDPGASPAPVVEEPARCFVPLLALLHSNAIRPPSMQVVAGFIAFGCVASGTYLINDLSDLKAGRAHPTSASGWSRAAISGRCRRCLLALALIVGRPDRRCRPRDRFSRWSAGASTWR